MRKYFHKTTTKMTETEEKLNKVMEHYALREPDMSVAKLLVKGVFRDTADVAR